MRHVTPGRKTVDLVLDREHGRAHYGGLMVCGSVWSCPVCAAKITERRRRELLDALDREPGRWTLAMVTYTLQHSRADTLAEVRDALLDAYRRVIRGAPWKRFRDRWGVAGYVKALEVTYGEHGWHPHCHVLLVLDRDQLSESESAAMRGWLSDRFVRMVAKNERYASDYHAVDLVVGDQALASYTTKTSWGAVDELTKAPVKAGRDGGQSPWELLDRYGSGDKQAGALFKEYALTMKGSRQQTFSRGTRDLLGMGADLSDQVLAELEQEAGVVLATLTVDEWKTVCRRRARGLLLEVASSGNVLWLWSFLASLGIGPPGDE